MTGPVTKEEIGHGLTTYRQPLKLMGADFGTRMAVMAWEGGVTIVNPGSYTEEFAKWPVAEIVSLNPFHHMFLDEWLEAFPKAKFYCLSGLAERYQKFACGSGFLDEKQILLAGDTVHYFLISGNRLFSEALCIHRPSKSLLVTDLAFNFAKSDKLWEQVLFRAFGVYDKFGTSPMVKLLMRDKARVTAVLEKVVEANFDRIIPAHGEILSGPDVKEKLLGLFSKAS